MKGIGNLNLIWLSCLCFLVFFFPKTLNCVAYFNDYINIYINISTHHCGLLGQ